MLKYVTLLIFVAAGGPLFAQAPAPTFEWAYRTGSISTVTQNATVYMNDMRLDRYGHIYTCGSYSKSGGSVDFNPGPGIDTLPGSLGLFLTKQDTSGRLIWVKQLAGAGVELQRMTTDSLGNLYFTGYFNSTVDMDPGPAVHNISTHLNSEDVFVCKLDSAGNYQWAYGMGGTGPDIGKSVFVDGSGNVYLTGYFEGTMDADPGPGVDNLISLYRDPFFIKLNSNGVYQWGGNISGFGQDQGRDITVDNSGDVYITGVFTSTADFDPGPAVYNLNMPTSFYHVYLLKLNGNGGFVYAKGFGNFSSASHFGENVSTNDSGQVFLSGLQENVMDADPGPGTYNLTPTNSDQYFMIKLTAAGNFVWGKGFGTTITYYTNNLRPHLRHSIDTAGNIYFTGNFWGTRDFDPGPGVHTLTSGNAGWSMFLLALDSEGSYRWAGKFGGENQGNWAISVQTDARLSIYGGGTFVDTSDFDPGPGVYLLQNPPHPFGNGWSNYLLKLRQCFANGSSLSAAACGSYTLNGQTYTQSGSYSQTYVNAGGCDSVVHLNLVVGHPDTTVVQSGSTLSAVQGGALYQWIKCPDMTPVAGAQQSQFTPSSSGGYALVITTNGCSDTSFCHEVSLPNGIAPGAAPGRELSLGPNPAGNLLYLQGIAMDRASLYGQDGRLIAVWRLQGARKTVVSLEGVAPGTYLLRVTSSDGRAFNRKVTRQ